jgi:hypothetical protein
MKTVAASLLLWLVGLGANAQPVYRCGAEYSQTPCPQGRLVDASDSRTEAQRADAQRVAADERRRADEMRRDRLADEARIRPAGVSSLSGPTPAPAKQLVVAERSRTKKKHAALQPVASTEVIAVIPSSHPRHGRP